MDGICHPLPDTPRLYTVRQADFTGAVSVVAKHQSVEPSAGIAF